MSYDKALEAMWKGEYDTALTELQSLSPAEINGDTHALEGLAWFHKERYRKAKDCYDKAVNAGGANAACCTQLTIIASGNRPGGSAGASGCWPPRSLPRTATAPGRSRAPPSQ